MSSEPRGALVLADGTHAPLLFDGNPIAIGGFRLQARSAVPIGKPGLKGWIAAAQFAGAALDASPYWIGDLVAYAESRAEWREKLDQAIALTGLSEQTLHNYGYIARRVEEPERAIAQSLAHAAEVAPLERVEQARLLEKSRTEGWTRRELRLEIRAEKRRRVIEGQAALEGMYRVVYADYPWIYSNRPPSGTGQAEHYPGMPIEEGLKLPIAAHVMPDAVLFFWVTSSMLNESTDGISPDWFRLINAWGFTGKTSIVWDKVDHGWGNYVSVRHEFLIIATRGSCTPDRPTPMPDSVITERPDPTHSKKPETFRRLIEKLYDGPYLELFGRDPVAGWTVFGNDARLWAEEVQQQAATA